jgi:hypothetical protein
MGWEKDLYGTVYKSQKTKDAAAKRKATNDAKKQREADAYDRAFTSGVQSYAKQNNMTYSQDMKDAMATYYNTKENHEKFVQDSVNESKRRNKAELKSYASFAANPDNQSKIDEYNQAKKKMGMQPDNMVTQKKYDQMFGYDTKKGVDNGMFNRYQEYKTSKDLKVNHNDKTTQKGGLSFGKTLDKFVSKGLSGANNFVDEYAPGVKKDIKSIIKSKPGQTVVKGLDTLDRYTTGIMRNIADTNIKDLNETQKYIDEQKKKGKKLSLFPNSKNEYSLKTQSVEDLKKFVKKEATDSIDNKRRADLVDVNKNAGISTGSKYGDKALAFIQENTLDPTNIVGAGLVKTGLKALKGVSKAGKVVEEADLIKNVAENGVKKSDAKKVLEAVNKIAEKNKANELPNINTLPKNYEGLYLIKDEYPMQTKIELQKANEAIKKGDIQPNKVEDTIEDIKAAQNTALTDRQRNLQNIKLPNGKIEVQPTIKKSLADLMGKKEKAINPKDLEAEKQQLELIHQADKEQFAKQNSDVIQGISETRQKALSDLSKQEMEWEGHQAATKQYDDIMKKVGGRLNIPKDNHADFATQLGKHMYSAKGKGKGDDIYKVAEDLGFNNPDELIQSLNNGYASKQIVKAGRNKFVTTKDLGDPDPQTILDEMHSQTESSRQIQKDISNLSQLPIKQELAKTNQSNKLLNYLSNQKKSTALKEAVQQARKTGNTKGLVKHADDIIKDLESKGVDDEEINTLKEELKGLKLNLQTFAGKPEELEKLLNRVETVNKRIGDRVKNGYFPNKIKQDQLKFEHGEIASPNTDKAITSVNDAYTPEIQNEQVMNFETGQVEPKKLTQSEEFKARSENIVNDFSDSFKNPGSFSLYRETPERNFDKIFPENAQEMKDAYLEPTKKAETERINFKNNINEQVKKMYKDLKISKKDDELIQEYGEGKISLDELKSRTDNWKNVEPAVTWYRNLYDQTLEQINSSLVRNDYNPIPKRKDYFPHYNKKGGLLKDIFGIDKTDHGLPTDINGLTDQFRPGKTYFTAAQRRTGDKTAYGALEGLSNYIEGASNLIYHTDNIKNIRSLEDAIREKFGSSDAMDNVAAYLRNYGDQMAGKKGRLDRGAEELFGRTMYNTAKTLQSNIGKAMVGGNVNSALSGLIPITTAAATTSKKALAQGLKDTIAAVVKDDGFKTPFMIRRMGADPLYMNKWEKASDKAFWMMKQVDNFATNFIVRSKYRELINKGSSHEAAVKGADNYAAKVMADRSKGQQPLLFNQRTLGPITQFQLEVNNQLSHIIKDIPEMAGENAKSRKGKILRTSAIYGQLALYGWLYNNLSQKVTGRRTAFDPIKYAQQFHEGNSIEGSKGILGQIPGTGMVVDGRTPVSATLPDVPGAIQRVQQSEGGLSDVLKEVGKAGLQGAPYLAGVPGYGQAKKSYEGIKATDKKGSYTDSGMLRYPIEVNPLKAAQLGIFGQYSPKEAQKYFDEGRKPLSGKRTAKVDSAQDRQKAYIDVLIDSANAKIKRNKGNAEKLKKLNADLKQLKQEKKQL